MQNRDKEFPRFFNNYYEDSWKHPACENFGIFVVSGNTVVKDNISHKPIDVLIKVPTIAIKFFPVWDTPHHFIPTARLYSMLRIIMRMKTYSRSTHTPGWILRLKKKSLYNLLRAVKINLRTKMMNQKHNFNYFRLEFYQKHYCYTYKKRNMHRVNDVTIWRHHLVTLTSR